MSGKVKIGKSKASKTLDVKEMNRCFSQMMGMTDADSEILLPKFVDLRNAFNQYYKLINLFGRLPVWRLFPAHAHNLVGVVDFLQHLRENCGVTDGKMETIEQHAELDTKTLNMRYRALCESNELKLIIITGSKLLDHKIALSDPEHLSDMSIKSAVGPSFEPFAFCKLNFKFIFQSDIMTPELRVNLLRILSKAMTLGVEMRTISTSANVDIDKFTSSIAKCIPQLRRQIPRCDKAFDILADSVDVLKGNFMTYHQDAVRAKNPNLIVQNYIIDVGLKYKTSPSITGQFNRIMKYLKNEAAKHKKVGDPALRSTLSFISSQLSAAQKSEDKAAEESPDEKDVESKDAIDDSPDEDVAALFGFDRAECSASEDAAESAEDIDPVEEFHKKYPAGAIPVSPEMSERAKSADPPPVAKPLSAEVPGAVLPPKSPRKAHKKGRPAIE